MLIYLLRHGLTEYNAQKRYQGQRDIPLSPEGLAHAAAHSPDGEGTGPQGKACAGGRAERNVLRQF